MPANNSEFAVGHKKPLYHGTPAKLNVGDVLNPGRDGLAFGTTDLYQAHLFGSIKADQQSGKYGSPHHIYQVEPLGALETKYEGSDMPYYGSSSGMKIVKEIPCQECESLGRGQN